MEIDHELILRTFQVESDELLTEMEEALLVLETRPEDEEALQKIFRVAHTLKGSASSLGFQALTEFAHTAEDLLQRLRNRTLPVTGGLITLFLQVVDAFRRMVTDAVGGTDEISPSHAALLQRLTADAPTAQEEEEEEEEEEGATLSPAPTESPREPSAERPEEIPTRSRRARTLRVDIEKLDRMVNLAGEIAIAQGRLRQLLEDKTGQRGKEVLEAQEGVDRLWMDLQEQIMKVRMVPVGPTFRQYARTVRDVARSCGKLARLLIEGGDVEVDTTVIEHLRDPLTHMIRNAVDHGIEPPQVRTAQGKDPCGCIVLRASHDAGSIVIQVTDDGAGFSRERIIERARARGTVSEPEQLTDEELFRLVFEPGFSTAQMVTDLSGRGIGMDVVQRNIDTLHGSVAIRSEERKGTTITIRLPLTLAIIEGFAVGVGEETYVIPLDAIIECMELPEEERGQADGRGMINLRGEPLPYARLRRLFHGGGLPRGREHIVVVKHGGRRVGLVVDTLYGESQAVIKPLGRLLQGLPGISGSTILGNGRVALILDVAGLLRPVGRERQTGNGKEVEEETPKSNPPARPPIGSGPHAVPFPS